MGSICFPDAKDWCFWTNPELVWRLIITCPAPARKLDEEPKTRCAAAHLTNWDVMELPPNRDSEWNKKKKNQFYPKLWWCKIISELDTVYFHRAIWSHRNGRLGLSDYGSFEAKNWFKTKLFHVDLLHLPFFLNCKLPNQNYSNCYACVTSTTVENSHPVLDPNREQVLQNAFKNQMDFPMSYQEALMKYPLLE